MKKINTWPAHIERCKISKLSKREYCDRHGLSYAMFFYHQRKLKEFNVADGFHQVHLDQMLSARDELTLHDELRVQLNSGAVVFFPERLLPTVIAQLQQNF